MEVIAAMIDYTLSESTGEFIESTLSRKKNEGDTSYESRAKREKEEFTEFWTFIRINNTWQLNDIKQG
jgi:predicted lipid-binding transport protein (Tim44 family)